MTEYGAIIRRTYKDPEMRLALGWEYFTNNPNSPFGGEWRHDNSAATIMDAEAANYGAKVMAENLLYHIKFPSSTQIYETVFEVVELFTK
jgi:hypothetical protein